MHTQACTLKLYFKHHESVNMCLTFLFRLCIIIIRIIATPSCLLYMTCILHMFYLIYSCLFYKVGDNIPNLWIIKMGLQKFKNLT